MRIRTLRRTRYLRAKRRQAFIRRHHGDLRLGVAAGCGFADCGARHQQRLSPGLAGAAAGSTAHISLLRVESDGMRDWRPLLEKLSKQPHVVAAAPAIYEQVLISRGPR